MINKLMKTFAIAVAACGLFVASVGAQDAICPDGMVDIDGGFCIDVYEYPNRKGAFPAKEVVWSDAVRKCSEAGKRLCTFEEWNKSCSGPNGTKYPYGNEFKEGVCNDFSGAGNPTLTASGDKEECVSGYGVYDMSGNVWEWIADRYKNGASRGIRGGSPASTDAGFYACGEPFASDVDTVYELNGFRCCADAGGQEPVDVEMEIEKAEADSKAAPVKKAVKGMEPTILPARPAMRGYQTIISPLTATPLSTAPPGTSASIEYVDLGGIGAPRGGGASTIDASAIAFTVGHKFVNNVRIDYTYLDHRADINTGTTQTTDKMSSHFFHVGYSLPPISRVGGNWIQGMSMGVRYTGESGGKVGEVYVAKVFKFAKTTLTPGINYLDNGADAKLGFTLNARYLFDNNVELFANYSSNDFYKTFANYSVPNATSLTSFYCADCKEDALSLGLGYSLPDAWGNIYFMMYDVADRSAPLAGAAVNF